MRRRLSLLLLVLSVTLMGSQCEVGASVNNGVVREDEGGQERSESGLSGGLVVVVRDGDVDGDLAVRQGSIVATALSTGLIDPPISERASKGLAAPPSAISEPVVSAGPIQNVESELGTHPVPEPRGILLFALGLASIFTATWRSPAV